MPPSTYFTAFFLFSVAPAPADLTRQSLLGYAAQMFTWLVVSSIVTGVGIVFEIPAEFRQLSRWWNLKKLKKPIGWAFPATFFGLVLVIGGIIGEGIFEYLSANAETNIREYHGRLLGNADARLGQTMIEASARSIPDPAELTESFKSFKGQKITALSNAGDTEAYFLCIGLVALSNNAGVHFADECWHSPPMKPLTGIAIFGPNEPSTFDLDRALIEAGIPGGISMTPSGKASDTPLILFVGAKPPVNSGQYPKPVINSQQSAK